jgi:glycine betaine/choline ABC-type transport system substrate-binding protein
LGGQIGEAEMRQMNYEVDTQHRDSKIVASEFLRQKGL